MSEPQKNNALVIIGIVTGLLTVVSVNITIGSYAGRTTEQISALRDHSRYVDAKHGEFEKDISAMKGELRVHDSKINGILAQRP